MESTVTVTINDQPVRLNAFVQKALIGVVRGFLVNLDDVPTQMDTIRVDIGTVKKEAKP